MILNPGCTGSERNSRMPSKILIIEDNEKNRTLITDVLEYYGYDVRAAADGASGFEIAKAYLPDVILMDIQMPVMDGIATAKMLKSVSATASIKLIALTSFAMKGDRERFLEAGFDDYIAKPIDTRKLPEIVKKFAPVA